MRKARYIGPEGCHCIDIGEGPITLVRGTIIEHDIAEKLIRTQPKQWEDAGEAMGKLDTTLATSPPTKLTRAEKAARKAAEDALNTGD